jgi:ABC-type multidrug transport system fused ATPase/permease subunit
LTNKSKLSESLKKFEHLENKDEELNQKLSEFINLLEESKLDSENIKLLQTKINGALEEKISGKTLINEIKDVSLSEIDKIAQLDKLEFLLNNNHLDSDQAKKVTLSDRFIRIIKIFIGFLFVTLGFAMIIMPAPPYFEMFTIFYFNPNDGVTLMDLISLIIIAVGIYIIVKSISNLKTHE